MARGLRLLGSVLVSSAALASACSVGNDCDFGLCEEYKDPPDGGVDAHPIPSNCDISQEPKDEPTCVVDDVGIFVSPDGTVGAAGTRDRPVRTIAEALQKAVSSGRGRVYVCDGQYPESVSVTAGIGIYGGFDCNWNYTAVKPKINSPSSPALALRSVAAQVVVEDLAINAPSSAGTAGDSAIGALVLQSTLVLRRVTLAAGAGQAGQKGTGLSNYPAATKIAATGAVSSAANGGDVTTCTCTDKTTSTGGHGANGNGAGFTEGDSVPAAPPGGGGAGTSNTTACDPGGTGADGASAAANDPLATAPGTVTPTGWDISKLAPPASNGNPGQGGGGGGARTISNSGGGGGGCGGCGGAGANAGTNGGASIGLLSYKSLVTLEACTVTTSSGGAGGAGGDGQSGQSGGPGGFGGMCSGGAGGNGAGGNGGAGGAGGDSIAIASGGGAAPTVSADTTLTVGSGGAGGDGGNAGTGSGNPGNAGKSGPKGRSQKTLP